MSTETTAQADENPWLRRVLSGGSIATGIVAEVVAVIEIHDQGVNAFSVAKGILGLGIMPVGFMLNDYLKRPTTAQPPDAR